MVLGILIALHINNWNDKHKTNNSINDIYVITRNDLLTDIKKIDWVLVRSKFKDSIFRGVLDKEMTKDDYLNCNRCIPIPMGLLEYLLKSQDYRNKVLSFHRLYNGIYLGHLKKYQKRAMILIGDINMRLK